MHLIYASVEFGHTMLTWMQHFALESCKIKKITPIYLNDVYYLGYQTLFQKIIIQLKH